MKLRRKSRVTSVRDDRVSMLVDLVSELSDSSPEYLPMRCACHAEWVIVEAIFVKQGRVPSCGLCTGEKPLYIIPRDSQGLVRRSVSRKSNDLERLMERGT